MLQTDTTPHPSLSPILIGLLKGVVYRENDAALWQALLSLQARVRDYVSVVGLELMLDEAEGYAWLRNRPAAEGETELPRLIAKRPLSFPVSLLLALFRKKLVELDAAGGETRLILSRDDIVEMLRVFLPPNANEARMVDQIDTHINKIAEMGFIRHLRGQEHQIEVRRILLAFVDAQWLTEFDRRLDDYRAYLNTEKTND